MPNDLCSGWAQIGQHLNLNARQAQHLAAREALPVFKLGPRIVRARRSALDLWLAKREAAARRQGQ